MFRVIADLIETENPFFYVIGRIHSLQGLFQLELFKFRSDHKSAISLVWIFLVVILMVILRRIKDGSLDNFSHNWIDQFFGKIFLPSDRGLLLFLAQIHDRGPILSAYVGTLPVQRRGIMTFSKNGEDFTDNL